MALDCKDVKRAFMRIGVHGANLKYARATRTRGGGAFQKMDLVCKGKKCAIESHNEFFKRYSPNHPDADKNGYVNLPDIDLSYEKSAFRAAMTELEALGKARVCGTQSFRVPNGLLIKYSKSNSVDSDIFNFKEGGDPISWTRTFRSGKSFAMNY